MAFLTYEDVRQLVYPLEKSEILREAQSPINKLVFLSHSSQDKDHLAGTVRFFEKFGATVYVDVGDARLPVIPSPETAQILRDTINRCPRFVILVTPNSKGSKWIPWEIGLADGFKGVANVALLPMGESSIEEDWAKQEYLGLYPRIIKGRLQRHTSDVWKVFDPRDKTNWELNYWLHNVVA